MGERIELTMDEDQAALLFSILWRLSHNEDVRESSAAAYYVLEEVMDQLRGSFSPDNQYALSANDQQTD